MFSTLTFGIELAHTIPLQSPQATTQFNPREKQQQRVVSHGAGLEIFQLHCIILTESRGARA